MNSNNAAPPPKRFPLGKLLTTLFVVAPLSAWVCLWSLALGGAVVRTAFSGTGGQWAMAFLGLLFVLASLSFIYGLVVSLWWDRRQASISFALVFGLIVLSVFVFHIGDDALIRLRNGSPWSSRMYWETLAYGYVFLSGWILTVYLLLHAMYGRRRG